MIAKFLVVFGSLSVMITCLLFIPYQGRMTGFDLFVIILGMAMTAVGLPLLAKYEDEEDER